MEFKNPSYLERLNWPDLFLKDIFPISEKILKYVMMVGSLKTKQFSSNGSVKDMTKKANNTPAIQLRDVTTVILDPNRVSLKPKYPT